VIHDGASVVARARGVRVGERDDQVGVIDARDRVVVVAELRTGLLLAPSQMTARPG